MPCDVQQDFDRDVLVAVLEMPRPQVAEDAPPLEASHGRSRLIGVFDGLGGAGSKAVDGEDGSRSSAYYASRSARRAAEDFFNEGGVGPGEAASDLAGRLARQIEQALARANTAAPVPIGAIRSTMIRSYPTTAAMALIEPADDELEVTALWAGDSRCYVLTPSKGLQQLTRDDSRSGSDAMRALGEDSPMSNLLAADAPCRLNVRRVRIAPPCILIAATDGAFGCLQSPMHFEEKLLAAFDRAEEAEDWSQHLRDSFQPLANDDISLVAVFHGWPNIAAAAADFSSRFASLQADLTPLDVVLDSRRRLEAEAASARSEAENALTGFWSRYRAGYELLLSVDAR